VLVLQRFQRSTSNISIHVKFSHTQVYAFLAKNTTYRLKKTNIELQNKICEVRSAPLQGTGKDQRLHGEPS
jgi:hypothetical protein